MLETHPAGKTPRGGKPPTPPKPQPTHNFPMPQYTEKPGDLPHRQTPATNLLGRRRPTGEQISGMQYSHSHPWDKPA
jgi:hypothetical protein